jgi:hypothetical protein
MLLSDTRRHVRARAKSGDGVKQLRAMANATGTQIF